METSERVALLARCCDLYSRSMLQVSEISPTLMQTTTRFFSYQSPPFQLYLKQRSIFLTHGHSNNSSAKDSNKTTVCNSVNSHNYNTIEPHCPLFHGPLVTISRDECWKKFLVLYIKEADSIFWHSPLDLLKH